MGWPTWHKRVTRGRLDMTRLGPAPLAATQQKASLRRYREILPTTGWYTKTVASNPSPGDPTAHHLSEFAQPFDTVGVQGDFTTPIGGLPRREPPSAWCKILQGWRTPRCSGLIVCSLEDSADGTTLSCEPGIQIRLRGTIGQSPSRVFKRASGLYVCRCPCRGL
jgi:hypothetical protein